jgi:hypothetical protein
VSSPARHYAPVERRWRLVLTAVLAVYGWVLLRSPASYTWLDGLDLAIHETGHLVFAIGGEFLTLLGGTLLQLLVPVAFAVALWRQGDRHGATVPLWWLGQSGTAVVAGWRIASSSGETSTERAMKPRTRAPER